MLLALAVVLAATSPPPPPCVPPAQDDGAVQEAASPEDRLRAIEKDFEDAMKTFSKAYSEASEQERNGVFETLYPDANDYVPRFMALADEVPGTETAAAALVWVATRSSDQDLSGDALNILVHDHIESPHIKGICRLLEGRYGDGEEFLRKILETSPHRDVKGRACFSLATNVMTQATMARSLQDPAKREAYDNWLGKETAERLAASDPVALQARAEKLFERVIAEYGDVDAGLNAKLADRAEANLFEIRNLQIGMTAPDIEGEDIDGTAFKLSDYRGKVVVLDFWGNW